MESEIHGRENLTKCYQPRKLRHASAYLPVALATPHADGLVFVSTQVKLYTTGASMARMRFEIVGESGGVSLPTYSTTTFKLLQLLREIDSAISGKSGGMVSWYVVDLKKNGTLALEIESRLKKPPKRRRVQIRDTAPAVSQSLVTGFENMEIRGISPPYLSEFGLAKLQGMMGLLQKNGARGFIATAVEEHRAVSVTEKSARTLAELLPPRREERASVEGALETISIHGKKRFIVYDSITRKGVTCILGEEEDRLQEVTAVLGRKVIVSGVVHYNIKNEPVRIAVERLRVLPPDKTIPTAKQLTGSDPNFTGEMTTEEYIRSIRRA